MKKIIIILRPEVTGVYVIFVDATDCTGFCAVKLTALGRPQLLVRVNHNCQGSFLGEILRDIFVHFCQKSH